ncbi:MAG: phosphomannomutase [Candidatus Neoclostridium sp.]
MKKLLAFDLDGTLTQHKTPIGDENREMLVKLSEKYKLIMLGAGACERVYEQLRKLPIEIVGSYGMQQSRIVDGKFCLIRNEKYDVDRDFFEKSVAFLRDKFGLNDYFGDSVEYHASGLVTFPILGTKAPLEKKLAYDPDRSKRRAMFPLVKSVLDGYNVFIGGSSSFDITRGEYNKFYALSRYCKENGYSTDEALMIGDDFGEGGNDSAVKNGGIDCIEIDDYRNFPLKTAFLLD